MVGGAGCEGRGEPIPVARPMLPCAAANHEPLPVTEVYARRAIGLPFWQGLTEGQIAAACRAVGRAVRGRQRAATRAMVSA